MNDFVFAVDDVKLIYSFLLCVDDVSLNFMEFFPDDFKGKVVIGFEETKKLQDSFCYGAMSRSNVIFDTKVTALSEVEVSVDEGKGRGISKKIKNNRDQYIKVIMRIDSPHVDDESKKDNADIIIEKSSIINFNFVIYDEIFDAKCLAKSDFQYFCGLSYLGFALVDIPSLNNYLSGKDYNDDLIDAFTTTELAGELFEEGILILTWGNTPWVYYISTYSNNKKDACFLGDKTGYSGEYKIKHDIAELSIIPCNALRHWSLAKDKTWPVLNIGTGGDKVLLDLFVKKAYSQGDMDYPIPTFRVKRESGEVNIMPLLESYIK